MENIKKLQYDNNSFAPATVGKAVTVKYKTNSGDKVENLDLALQRIYDEALQEGWDAQTIFSVSTSSGASKWYDIASFDLGNYTLSVVYKQYQQNVQDCTIGLIDLASFSKSSTLYNSFRTNNELINRKFRCQIRDNKVFLQTNPMGLGTVEITFKILNASGVYQFAQPTDGVLQPCADQNSGVEILLPWSIDEENTKVALPNIVTDGTSKYLANSDEVSEFNGEKAFYLDCQPEENVILRAQNSEGMYQIYVPQSVEANIITLKWGSVSKVIAEPITKNNIVTVMFNGTAISYFFLSYEDRTAVSDVVSSDGSVSVTKIDGKVDLKVPTLKILEGYGCGFSTTSTTGYAKFCDLYWTKIHGAIDTMHLFKCTFQYIGSGWYVLYSADVKLVFGEQNGSQVCNIIVSNECAYESKPNLPNYVKNYKISNVLKVDYINDATRDTSGDPKKSDGWGHAVVMCNITDTYRGNIHFNPVSSLSIKYNNSNTCYFDLNPECVKGLCSVYTPQGTIQSAIVDSSDEYKEGLNISIEDKTISAVLPDRYWDETYTFSMGGEIDWSLFPPLDGSGFGTNIEIFNINYNSETQQPTTNHSCRIYLQKKGDGLAVYCYEKKNNEYRHFYICDEQFISSFGKDIEANTWYRVFNLNTENETYLEDVPKFDYYDIREFNANPTFYEQYGDYYEPLMNNIFASISYGGVVTFKDKFDSIEEKIKNSSPKLVEGYGITIGTDNSINAEVEYKDEPRGWRESTVSVVNSGLYVWKDNDGHIYYSENSSQYELVGDTWVEKDWGSIVPALGSKIWHAPDNRIFYDYQYELVNGAWVSKSWGSKKPYFTSITEYSLWRYKDKLYYDNSADHYVYENGMFQDRTEYLDRPKGHFWYDTEGNIYVSKDASSQYVLTDEGWVTKDWGTKVPIDGQNVWTDGVDVFYSYGVNQYVLRDGVFVDNDYNNENFTIVGYNIWTDNNGNIYWTTGSQQRIYKRRTESYMTAHGHELQQKLVGGEGIIMDGNVISVDASKIGGKFVLPTASSTVLGGVKVGEEVSDTSDMTPIHINNGTIYYQKNKVQDNLVSTSTTDSLSANQGKILNEKITNGIVKSGCATKNTRTEGGWSKIGYVNIADTAFQDYECTIFITGNWKEYSANLNSGIFKFYVRTNNVGTIESTGCHWLCKTNNYGALLYTDWVRAFYSSPWTDSSTGKTYITIDLWMYLAPAPYISWNYNVMSEGFRGGGGKRFVVLSPTESYGSPTGTLIPMTSVTLDTKVTKAIQDENGNAISTSYVTIGTAQTISGAKTFSTKDVHTDGVMIGESATKGCTATYSNGALYFNFS